MPTRRGPDDPGRDGDAAGKDRRRRNRVRRSRRYSGTKTHKTRVCRDCRAHIPYVEGVTPAPSTCPDCGFRFDCPECGVNLVDADDPAICPTCEEPLTDDAPDPEETFTWDK